MEIDDLILAFESLSTADSEMRIDFTRIDRREELRLAGAMTAATRRQFTLLANSATRYVSPMDGVNESHLIAIGTQGRSGLNRFFMGSVAEWVLHHAHCPVVTVRRLDAGNRESRVT